MAKGDTAIRHARAVIKAQWPEQPVLQARQVVVYTGRGRRTVLEDVFGVFDFIIVDHAGDLIGIQVTTQGEKRSSTADRKRKIKNWIEQHWGPTATTFKFKVLLWAWVRGSHFREWKWGWDLPGWVEAEPVRSPLIKS